MGCLKLDYYITEKPEKQDFPLFFYVSQKGGFQYVYCRNNPVILIDPDGKDDYFTNSGRYLGSDGDRNSHNIRIISEEVFNMLGTSDMKYNIFPL